MFISCFSRNKAPPPPPISLDSLHAMGNTQEKPKPASFTKSMQDGFIELFGWMAEDSDNDDENGNDQQGNGNSIYGGVSGSKRAKTSQNRFPLPKVRKMQYLKESYDVDFDDLSTVLGKGHFATVYRGQDKRPNGLLSLRPRIGNETSATSLDSTRVAVKRISRSITKIHALVTEVKALCKVAGHPNIVRLYDVFYDDQYVVLILEYLAGGELFTRIVKGGAYSERDASIHIRKITQALQYMHDNGVVHRDLKPENLVLAEARLDSEIKISDFGLSRLLRSDEHTMITVCGTKAYSAPEIDFGAKKERRKPTSLYTNKVDTWSLGVILYVILAAYHPFDPYGRDSDSVIWERIVRGEWDFNDKVWTKISVEAKDLICHLICVEPDMRYDTKDILIHPWILKYDLLPKNDLKSLSSRSLLQFTSTGNEDQQGTPNGISAQNEMDSVNRSSITTSVATAATTTKTNSVQIPRPNYNQHMNGNGSSKRVTINTVPQNQVPSSIIQNQESSNDTSSYMSIDATQQLPRGNENQKSHNRIAMDMSIT